MEMAVKSCINLPYGYWSLSLECVVLLYLVVVVVAVDHIVVL